MISLRGDNVIVPIVVLDRGENFLRIADRADDLFLSRLVDDNLLPPLGDNAPPRSS